MSFNVNDSVQPVPASSESRSVDAVIDVAIQQFSEFGYSEAKLESISRLSGMSKRMIHYHFGDKKGLYRQALAVAAQRLSPPVDALEIESGVPVEGVRKLVDRIFQQHSEHPEALSLLAQENRYQLLENTTQAITDVSEVSLHLDKLLMLGQDSGAFRPGISANDIFTLISSLTMYRVTNHAMMHNLLRVDMLTETNTAGIHRLMVDAVLSFLTANIPDSGHQSYLVADSPVEEDGATGSDIYSGEDPTALY
ncbi:TetR family transcriptional regulator [Corynebacterium flavescens]